MSDSESGPSTQARLVAQALYEIRLLLSDYLGSEAEGDLHVRQAAYLAYALHNEAEALASGDSFDITEAMLSINRVDAMLGSDFKDRFKLLTDSPKA